MSFNKGDKGVSVLKNFEPVFKQDGTHDTYTPQGKGTFYKFKLTFDNGLEGNANSKTQTGEAYTTGEKYNWEITFKNDNFTNLRVSKEDAAGGRKKYDPDAILMSVACECAIITIEKASQKPPGGYDHVRQMYAKFLIREISVKKLDAINIQAALKRAVMWIGVRLDDIGNIEVDSWEDVLRKAVKIYEEITDKAWINQIRQQLSSESSNNSSTENNQSQQNSQGQNNPNQQYPPADNLPM